MQLNNYKKQFLAQYKQIENEVESNKILKHTL